MLLDLTVISRGLFMAAVDYIPSLLLHRVQKTKQKKKSETQITFVALINTSLSNREVLMWEGRLPTGKRASQQWITDANPFWRTTARFTLTEGKRLL